MEVTPTSNITHVHQNTLVASTKQADFQNRLDVQNNAIQESLKEKEKEVEEIRPTEETYRIDPEKEHERNHKEQEGEAYEALAENEEDKSDKSQNSGETRLLDIRV
jgi:regulator of protease activity HflC (stomatin/prohibitin superfamily)